MGGGKCASVEDPAIRERLGSGIDVCVGAVVFMAVGAIVASSWAGAVSSGTSCGPGDAELGAATFGTAVLSCVGIPEIIDDGPDGGLLGGGSGGCM